MIAETKTRKALRYVVLALTLTLIGANSMTHPSVAQAQATSPTGIDVRTPSLWLRARQWLVAFDEAMHLAEADNLAARIGRLEARVAAMEDAGNRSPEDPVKAQVNQRMGTSVLVAQGPSRLEQKDIAFDMSNETGA